MRGRSLIATAAMALLVLFWSRMDRGPSDDVVTVFAAASLREAVTEFGQAYRQRTGERLRFSFAATSTLARQIEAGALADIFVAANADWVTYLATRGLVDAHAVRQPIANRLVLVAARSAAPVMRIEDIEIQLGPDGRLAIGDPVHVPAGVYAKQALSRLGLWSRLKERLAPADNVRAALALVALGEAPLGIVYATDSRIESGVRTVAVFDDVTHDEIVYSFVPIRGRDSSRAREVFASLTGDQGVAVFAELGFVRR